MISQNVSFIISDDENAVSLASLLEDIVLDVEENRESEERFKQLLAENNHCGAQDFKRFLSSSLANLK